MAFITKVWKDRLVEYAGRRKLTNVATGEELLVDVSRSEGTVNQAGDAFSATNMNNLEQRIKNEFDNLNESLEWKTLGTILIEKGATFSIPSTAKEIVFCHSNSDSSIFYSPIINNAFNAMCAKYTADVGRISLGSIIGTISNGRVTINGFAYDGSFTIYNRSFNLEVFYR